MLYYYDLSEEIGRLRFNIWIDELPFLCLGKSMIGAQISNKKTITTPKRKLAVEYLNLGTHRNYGLLGFEYTPENSSELRINLCLQDIGNEKVDIDYNGVIPVNSEVDFDCLSGANKIRRIGSCEEYNDIIMKTANEFFEKKTEIPSGKIEYVALGQSVTGSSQLIYKYCNYILLNMLVSNKDFYSKDEIIRYILPIRMGKC